MSPRLASLLAFCALLAIPHSAWAWGPGMHLELALHCLEHLDIATPALAALLKEFPYDFMYGAVSPDIFLSKMRAGALFHCHNWRMGHLLLSEAENDRLRAAVYGYLVHLAADVVAHNYFVPYKIIANYSARISSHLYWEMRYDLTVANHTWRVVPRIVQGDYQEFDALLERVLKKTLFSFRTSKRIFQSLLVVNRIGRVRASLRAYTKRSRLPLHEKRIMHFRDLTIDLVEDFLRHPDTARCLEGDPTGRPRESAARQLRKRMRRAMERGELTKNRATQFIAHCDERLRNSMCQADIEWPNID